MKKSEMRVRQRTGDMFDVPQVWKTDPAAAFDAFIASVEFVELSQRRPNKVDENGKPKPLHPLRPSSAAIYRHMWKRFVRWTEEVHIPFYELSKTGIEAFLEERDEHGNRLVQSATIRRQYITMLERVYKHFGFPNNPASNANFDMLDSTDLRGQNKETVTLTPAQQQAFLDALPHVPQVEGDTMAGWETRRDRALQAVMLGAGLKVSEAIGLYTVNIQLDAQDDKGCVPVEISPASANGTVQWHTTLLRPPAAAIVLDWVAERKKLSIAGQLLFPTRTGGRVDKTWVYRKTRETYLRAGLDVPRKGGRTLRNTYAVSQLASGEMLTTVSGQLGHRTHRALETYTTALERQRQKQGEKTRKA